jgi:hypothetical protein
VTFVEVGFTGLALHRLRKNSSSCRPEEARLARRRRISVFA